MDSETIEAQYEALLSAILQAMEALASQMAEAASEADTATLTALSRQRKALERFQHQLIKAYRRWKAER